MNKKNLIDYLKEFVTEERFRKIQEVAKDRTHHLCVAVEDLYQAHNTNAVIRSAECFGVQNIHVIQNQFEFQVNREISMGASKWLDIHPHNTTKECIQDLKQKGYRVVATMPAEKDTMLDEIDLSTPVAFLFGTEKFGLTAEAIDMADEFVKIPMYGFTESYNVSVSSALVMMSAMSRLRKSDISWELSESEQHVLMLKFLRASIREVDKIEKRYAEINT